MGLSCGSGIGVGVGGAGVGDGGADVGVGGTGVGVADGGMGVKVGALLTIVAVAGADSFEELLSFSFSFSPPHAESKRISITATKKKTRF